jgi:hypothetical protein
MPPSPRATRAEYDASGDVIYVPDDDEELFDTVQPAAAAAAVAEWDAVQGDLACSKEVQHDAGQWPVLRQQVLAQWWT